MAGRKRLPTSLKILKGTMQPCRTNDNEPIIPIIKELPEPPEYFSAYARKIYLETGLELINNGILTKIDFDMFLIYVGELAQYRDAQMQIHRTGRVLKVNNRPLLNPYVRVASESFAILIRVACEFGITPAARSKVSAIQKKYEPGDEFFK